MGQQIKDNDGRVLGHFLTPEEYDRLSDAANAEDFSEELHARATRQIESGEAERTGWSPDRVQEMLRQLDAILPKVRP
jgi:hypothetical protein